MFQRMSQTHRMRSFCCVLTGKREQEVEQEVWWGYTGLAISLSLFLYVSLSRNTREIIMTQPWLFRVNAVGPLLGLLCFSCM